MITGAQIRAARALLRWSAQDLTRQSRLGRSTVVRAEQFDGVPPVTRSNLEVIRRTFVEAGVVFIDADDLQGEGVRFGKHREDSKGE